MVDLIACRDQEHLLVSVLIIVLSFHCFMKLYQVQASLKEETGYRKSGLRKDADFLTLGQEKSGLCLSFYTFHLNSSFSLVKYT